MSNIEKFYKRHFLLAELLLSIIFTILVLIIIQQLWSPEALEKWINTNKEDIYPLVATIGGTLLGFVITGVSIILAFSESEKLRLLKRSKQYKTIFTIYFSAIKYLAITTVVAVIGIAINDNLAILMFYLLLWSVVISSLRIWRCIWILESIVKIISKSEKALGENNDQQ